MRFTISWKDVIVVGGGCLLILGLIFIAVWLQR